MTSSRSSIVVLSIFLTILVLVFLTLVGYVSWSLHLFHTKPPVFLINCTEMSDPVLLEEYLQNRTVSFPTNRSGELTKPQCWLINKRWYLPGDVPDSMEVHHPVYYIRIVSRNYAYFEETFHMLYSPLQFFCFPIGSTASESFEKKVRFLGICIPNVIIPEGKFDVSKPTEIFRAHTACFYRMNDYPWQHLFVSQESQIPLQSIHFISDLMRRIGMASKIGHEIMTEEQTRILNDSKNVDYNTTRDALLHYVCNWLHGKVEFIGLNRNMANVFYPIVLNSTHDSCLQPYKKDENCISQHYDKDGNCLWGMESLTRASNSKSLFIRADPEYDLGFIQCVHEFVFQRTYNTSFYNIHYGSH